MTSTITVTNAAWVDVVADSPCEVVKIRENRAEGTTDYDVRTPSGAAEIGMAAGEMFPFYTKRGNLFQRDEIVGQVKAVTAGVYTFSKSCEFR